MAAGPLNRRIRIERKSPVRDDMGGSAGDGWVPLWNGWAARVDMSASERFAGGETSGIRATIFRVRSSVVTRDVRADDRIFHKGAFYEITGTKETTHGLNRFLEFTTTVRTDAQDRDL